MMSFHASADASPHRIIIHDAWEHVSLDQNAMGAWFAKHYPDHNVEFTHVLGGGLHLMIHIDGPVDEADAIAIHFFMRWRRTS